MRPWQEALEEYDVGRGGEFCWHDPLWRAVPPEAVLVRFLRALGRPGDEVQARHRDDRHRREAAADDRAVDGADLGEARAIVRHVDDVPGHAHDMLGPRFVLGEDGERVEKHLPELADEIGRDDPLRLVPADHAGGEDEPADAGDAVRIAFGPRPAGRQQDLHARCSARWWRAITTFCTSEAPS